MTLFAPSDNNRSTRIQKAANAVLIFGFLVTIGVPFLGVFRGDVSREIETAEGRKAAAFPEIKLKQSGPISRPDSRSLKKFPHEFEKWFNDRMGFRRRLIQVYQVARYYGWTPSRLSKAAIHSGAAAEGLIRHLASDAGSGSGQPRVLIGRDGWLFYDGEDAIEDHRGTNLFSEKELARWKQILTERRDWLANRGIRYVFVIAPNKPAIYPEYMPRSINRVTEQSRLQQLTDYLARESDLTFINLREPILQAKSAHRVFHKTDTHWNAYGAFIGYQELMKPIKSWFPEVQIPSIDDYELVVHDCDISNVRDVSPWVKMDLAVMLASPIPYREEVIDLVPRREELKAPIQFRGTPHNDAERLRRQKFAHGQISNVFVLHDSFMMALSAFLTPNFREVTYKWTNEFPAEEIEKARPVLVIQQLVQRRLMNHEPQNPPGLYDQ